MVKAIMHGCSGKMGQVITGLIAEEKRDNNCRRSGSLLPGKGHHIRCMRIWMPVMWRQM